MKKKEISYKLNKLKSAIEKLSYLHQQVAQAVSGKLTEISWFGLARQLSVMLSPTNTSWRVMSSLLDCATHPAIMHTLYHHQKTVHDEDLNTSPSKSADFYYTFKTEENEDEKLWIHNHKWYALQFAKNNEVPIFPILLLQALLLDLIHLWRVKEWGAAETCAFNCFI